MKLYLKNVKTQVDPCPHISILLWLDSNDGDHCVTEQFMQIFVKKIYNPMNNHSSLFG